MVTYGRFDNQQQPANMIPRTGLMFIFYRFYCSFSHGLLYLEAQYTGGHTHDGHPVLWYVHRYVGLVDFDVESSIRRFFNFSLGALRTAAHSVHGAGS